MNATQIAAAHGPNRCHRRTCRAEPCKAAYRAYQAAHKRYRTRMLAYGRWQPFVDADPVRLHVAQLRSIGIGVDHLPSISGVSRRTVMRLMNGCNGKPPSPQVRTEIAEKLFAVRPDISLCAPGARIDITGTRRRLQALQVLGWSQSRLAARLGTTQPVVRRIVSSDQPAVAAATAVRVRNLYDRLWNVAPPSATKSDRQSATSARRRAAEHGWAPPMAWDDDSIDNPTAVPDGVAEKPHALRKLPEWSELLLLVDELGETHEAIAQRFNVHVKTVKSKLADARRKARQQDAAVTA